MEEKLLSANVQGYDCIKDPHCIICSASFLFFKGKEWDWGILESEIGFPGPSINCTLESYYLRSGQNIILSCQN
jgi:hypothetical protein